MKFIPYRRNAFAASEWNNKVTHFLWKMPNNTR